METDTKEIKELVFRRGAQAFEFVLSFFSLRTSRMLALTEGGPLWPRLEIARVFLYLAFGLGVINAVLFDNSSMPNIVAVTTNLISGWAISAVVTFPFFAFLYWLNRGSIAFSITFSSLLLALGMLSLVIGSLVVFVPTKSRMDFEAVAAGQGDGTEAYDALCRKMEDLAQETRLGRESIAMISRRDTAIKAANGDATLMDAAMSKWFTDMKLNAQQTVNIISKDIEYDRAFDRAYPNVQLSKDLYFWLALFLGAWAYINLFKAFRLAPSTPGGRLIAAIAFLLALPVAWGVATLITIYAPYPTPKSLDMMDPDTGEIPTDYAGLQRASEAFAAGQPQREQLVRAQFRKNAKPCPDIGNAGLW